MQVVQFYICLHTRLNSFDRIESVHHWKTGVLCALHYYRYGSKRYRCTSLPTYIALSELPSQSYHAQAERLCEGYSEGDGVIFS